MMKWRTVFISVVLFFSVLVSGCLDENDSNNEKEDFPHPDEVQLYFNHTDYYRTGSGKFLEVGGEPDGSNVTWTINDEIIGYGKKFQYMPRESAYKFLKVDVRWGQYEKNRSMWIVINQKDTRGGFEASSNGYGNEELGPQGYGLNIEPAITIPSLMLNVSASKINGTIHYWIKLREENKLDYFETVVDVEADLNEGNYTRSFFFDKLFFMDRSDKEPYLLLFLFMIESYDGSYSKVTTEEWLDY
jgi:hypothetical protein